MSSERDADRILLAAERIDNSVRNMEGYLFEHRQFMQQQTQWLEVAIADADALRAEVTALRAELAAATAERDKETGRRQVAERNEALWMENATSMQNKHDAARAELAAVTERAERREGRRFPVHTPEGGAPSSVPWAALAPFEAHAIRNHDQDLETLARRGGLGVCEMVAVLEGRRWKRMDNTAAVARLVELLANCPTCGAAALAGRLP